MKFKDYITERKLTKKIKEELVGTALQIVFEYSNWGPEHVSDMFDVIDRPKFSYDDLEDMTYEADKLKKKGFSWEESEKILMKMR